MLVVTASFILATDNPATGLTLSDIDFYLTRTHKITLDETVIWDGTENPTAEIANVGSYVRGYSDEDLDTYDYHAAAIYTGATSLQNDTVQGAASQDNEGIWSYETRTLTVPAVSSDSTTSTEITIKRGTTWTIQVTGLGDISSRTKLWFTVKRTKKQYADSQSTIQIEETAGLVYVNGAVATTPTNGTIVVDNAVDGDITITVDEIETQNIAEMNDGFWDVKVLSGGNVTVPAEGKFNVTLDVTQAIS